MKVLVAYASRHGSTAGIAERIAARITEDGIEAEARPVAEVDDVGQYEAVVLGSAAYLVHWLKEATTFAKRHRRELQDKKVWLFSSGPLGNETVDKDGEDILNSARPKQFTELQELLRPSGEQVFFGAWDPDSPPIGIGERLIRLAPAAKEALPAGDFRDWDAIDAWADGIAADLKSRGGPNPDGRSG
ncbi:flavodoxin domain-containing protein [Arthrobacter sp. AB6]|uniref:flavodoxin domain-containing protein n=1 Tax=Arthrobacter sp. AB6 TaxID=2962570 RepID=UPI00288288C3|nr:flavodoxin domain-containing protein [Arthrobacter sp. AB6]MDT0194060.1 flavodoxin domain-containing protein [Arthrobacter sp. AB6]